MGTENTDSSVAAILAVLLGSTLLIVVWIGFVLFLVIGMWKLFIKAGVAGWHSLIPVLSTYSLVKITGLHEIWFLYLFVVGLLSVPVWVFGLVALYFTYIVFRELRRSFELSDSPGAVIVFLLFSGITLPLLGIGSATYRGPQQSADVPALPGQ
ncbi:MAG: hypothetical protein RLZZ297_1646 [Chloroflexota bacterium]